MFALILIHATQYGICERKFMIACKAWLIRSICISNIARASLNWLPWLPYIGKYFIWFPPTKTTKPRWFSIRCLFIRDMNSEGWILLPIVYIAIRIGSQCMLDLIDKCVCLIVISFPIFTCIWALISWACMNVVLSLCFIARNILQLISFIARVIAKALI